jgi:ABC-type transport system involved in cytochrome bd biosynthesis fused ATPase/permease subunit
LNLDEEIRWLWHEQRLGWFQTEMRALHAMESGRMGEQAAADANSDLRRITLAQITNLKHATTNQKQVCKNGSCRWMMGVG